MGFWDRLWTDDWWLEHGLDGIIGGATGGAVTGLAVWLTIRHERRLRRETDLNLAIGRLHEACSQLMVAVADLQADALPEAANDVLSASSRTIALSTRQDPALTSFLGRTHEELLSALEGRTVAEAAKELHRVVPRLSAGIMVWLSDPKGFNPDGAPDDGRSDSTGHAK